MNYQSVPDETLFEKITEGNSLAFDNLFFRYYKNLCLFSYKVTKDNEAAQEIVQEFFIKIWQNRSEINITKSAKSYIYRSVYHATLNYIRDKKTNIDPLDNEKDHISLKSYDLADNEILYNELETRVFRIIDSFSEKQRNVFILKRFEDLSYKEIATKLNMSERMVEKYLSKSLAVLRQELAVYKNPYPGIFIFFI